MPYLRTLVFFLLCTAFYAAPAFSLEIPTFVMYSDVPLNISITAYDGDGVTFRLTDTGAEMTVKWVDLPSSEADRLKKIVGLDAGPEPVTKNLGATIVGERIYMKGSTIPIVGEVQPSTEPGVIFLNTRNVKGFKIRTSDIDRREALTLYESEIYGPEEIYERHVNRKPPKTAKTTTNLPTSVGNWASSRRPKVTWKYARRWRKDTRNAVSPPE
jgi:hypothetical protein